MKSAGVSAWLGGKIIHPVPSEVEIIAAPAGGSPPWVRKSWIGLTLPLAQANVVELETADMLAAPKNRFGWFVRRLLRRLQLTRGYLINASQAVEILDTANPEAAAWWRENLSHLLDGKHNVVFHEWACKPVKPEIPPSANVKGPAKTDPSSS